MWIMTQDGFFSIVNKDVKNGEMLVRGRIKEDLEKLADNLGIKRNKIVTTLMADYWYRLTVDAKDMGRYLSDSVEGIDYDNFKSSLPHTTKRDKERSRVYMKVWSALYELQNDRK